jgi:hypothetical protein
MSTHTVADTGKPFFKEQLQCHLQSSLAVFGIFFFAPLFKTYKHVLSFLKTFQKSGYMLPCVGSG